MLEEKNIKAGKRVECSGYLKALKMKYCVTAGYEKISEIKSVANEIMLVKKNDVIFQEQYSEESKWFEGIIVGKKKVALRKGYKWENNCCGEENKAFVRMFVKEEDEIMCVKVCYGLNRIRLVPLNLVKEKEENATKGNKKNSQ